MSKQRTRGDATANKSSKLEQIHGIGPETARALARLGIATLAALAAAETAELAAALDGSSDAEVVAWQQEAVTLINPPLTPPVASAATGGETDENTFTWRFDPAEAEQMYLAEMQHLVRCVERRYQGQPDLFQGILNLEWMDAAQRAAQTGTWQRINGEWARLAGRK